MLETETFTPTNIEEFLRSVQSRIEGKSAYARFRKMYSRDRIAFVYDMVPSFAKTIAPYQEEILGLFDEGINRLAVRGPHGLGKTAIASILVHHAILTSEYDCKVPTTASAWRQLEKYLWPEIKKSAKFLDWSSIGRPVYDRNELLTMSIKLNQGLVEAFAVASDDHTTIEGAHATRMFYVFDEAKTIPAATWAAAEGAFSAEGLEVSEYQRGLSEEKEIVDIVNVPDVKDTQIKVNSRNVSVNENDVQRDKNSRSNKVSKSFLESVSSNVSPVQGRDIDVSHTGGLSGNGSSVKDARGSSAGREFTPAAGSPRRETSHTTQTSRHTTGDLQVARHSASNSRHTSIVSVNPGEMIEDHRDKPIISTASTIYEALAFAISTPGDPSGQFYDIHTHKPGYEDWHTKHVTLEEAILAGRISRKWAEQRARQWGIDSAVYQNRVLGEFADNSEEGIIPRSWVLQANERWRNIQANGLSSLVGKEFLGVDVARSGEDKTVIAVRIGAVIAKIHIYSKLLTTAAAGHVKSLATGRSIHIEIDGGLGAAVFDILKEQGVTGLKPITVSARTEWRDRSRELRFINVRAAMWWNMRQMLDPTYGSEVALPPLEELTLDLVSPKWDILKDATVRLESKDQISKRIGRSTDYGDAVCLAFWHSSTGGGVVF